MTAEDVVEVSPVAPSGGRRRRWAVAATVAVLAAGGAGAAWAVAGARPSSAATGDSGPSCPATVPDPTSPTFDVPAPVPALPSASGVDGRLVPARPPGAVTVCEYPVVVHQPALAPAGAPAVTSLPVRTADPLGRSAELDGRSAAAAPLVATLQRATVLTGVLECGGAPVRIDAPRYLVALTYDDGVVWVATTSGCGPLATNGVDGTGTDLTGAITGVLDATGTSTAPVPGTAVPGTAVPSTPTPSASDDPLAPCAAGDAAPGGDLVDTGGCGPATDSARTAKSDGALIRVLDALT